MCAPLPTHVSDEPAPERAPTVPNEFVVASSSTATVTGVGFGYRTGNYVFNEHRPRFDRACPRYSTAKIIWVGSPATAGPGGALSAADLAPAAAANTFTWLESDPIPPAPPPLQLTFDPGPLPHSIRSPGN